MWIAKPISSLSEKERELWSRIEINLPLSQTLTWARAIEAISGRAYLVFSPEEQVGGMIFNTSDQVGKKFECINGPHLNWDTPNVIPRQLATFAMAASKLDAKFQSLSMKPRWEAGVSEQRLKLLPIPAFQESHAATLIVPLKPSPEEQLRSFSHRMRRTLSHTWKNDIQTKIEKITPESLQNFVPALESFSKTQGFATPPMHWFEALIQDSTLPYSPQFWLLTAQTQTFETERSLAQILICRHGVRAHYLFGYDFRSPRLRAAVSPAAAAQWKALTQCISMGLEHYDLNGYIIDAQPNHPYYGVCKFKEQFAGQIVKYDIPEFIIQ